MSNNDIANQIAFQEEEHQLIIVEGILDSLIEASEKDAKYKYNQARTYRYSIFQHHHKVRQLYSLRCAVLYDKLYIPLCGEKFNYQRIKLRAAR